jgi:hypothetical protein
VKRSFSQNFQHRVPQLAYVLAHDEPELMNSTQVCAIDRIYMRPLLTAQGGHEIFNVNMAEVIQRRNVTVLPITDEKVKVVKLLAKRDSMEVPKIESKTILYHDVFWCFITKKNQSLPLSFLGYF